ATQQHPVSRTGPKPKHDGLDDGIVPAVEVVEICVVRDAQLLGDLVAQSLACGDLYDLRVIADREPRNRLMSPEPDRTGGYVTAASAAVAMPDYGRRLIRKGHANGAGAGDRVHLFIAPGRQPAMRDANTGRNQAN